MSSNENGRGSGSKLLLSWACATAAAASFGITIWLALDDKSASATVMAYLTGGFALAVILPQFDTIEIFGMKGKIRQTLDDAQKIIAQLQVAATASSKVQYEQMAWMNDRPTWKAKAIWFGELNASLAKVGVDDRTIAELQKPFLSSVTRELCQPLEIVIGRRLQRRLEELSRRCQVWAQQLQSVDAPEIKALQAQMEIIDGAKTPRTPWMLIDNIGDLEAAVSRRIDELPLSNEERSKLEEFAKPYILISDEVHRVRGLTPDAERIVDVVPNWEAQYNALFPHQPVLSLEG